MSKAKVVVFATQKGGTGKSTLSVMCAVCAQETGKKVAILDMDKQGTVAQWSEEREADSPDVYAIEADQLEQAITALNKKSFDYIIIDTAGVDSPATTAALRCADLCLIPTRPAPQDLKALRPTHAAVVRLGKDFAFVLNQVGPRLYQRYREAVNGLSAIAVVAQPLIVQRNDHQDAFGMGQGATEYNPHGKAAEEIRELWQWITKRMEGRSRGAEKAA